MKRRLIWSAALSILLAGCGNQQEQRAERRTADRAEIERLTASATPADARAAILLIEERYGSEIAEGGEFRDAYNKATAIRREAEKQEAISRYKERLTAQISAIDEVNVGRPDSMAVIRDRLRVFENGARTLVDGREYAESAEVKADMQRLRRTLAEKQRQSFPQMRAGFGKAMGRELWENDVEVTVQGAGNRTVRFIAGMFAANRNIAAGQQAAQEVTSQLRFRRTQFEWYRGSEYTYYTLDTPDDGAVGTWSGSYFSAVPAS